MKLAIRAPSSLGLAGADRAAGGYRGAKLRHVSPAKRDEAGRTELLCQVGRYRERQVAQRPEPEGGHLAGDRAAQVLEQDGDAAEGAIGQVTFGLLAGSVEPGPDHRIQLWVEATRAPGDGR